ncbi:protein of unknown function [Methylorubrum extorquens]|uniref:NusB/RsmB/TIM44 domain-containing protein n=1 Tax=Methylorubrum extorquens TaxID=408 RepID=A0A2N9AYG0_METEX|nr:protein of unknown function [Methylorubrum extorquens]
MRPARPLPVNRADSTDAASLFTDRLRGEPHSRCAGGGGPADAPLRPCLARGGGCGGRARRRRPDASGAAPLHGHAQADLRHEPRHGRLPDERVPGRRPARTAGGDQAFDDPPDDDDRHRHRGEQPHGAGDQRGLHAAPDPPDREAAGLGGRSCPPAGTHRRRHPRRDARRLDRLQPLGRRADPAAQRASPGADANLGLPAPALARRVAAEPRAHSHRRDRRRTPPRRGGGRPHRVPPRLHGGDMARPRHRSRAAARPRPQPGRAHSARAIRLIRSGGRRRTPFEGPGRGVSVSVRSEVAGEALHLPVLIADRLQAAASERFGPLGDLGRAGVDRRPPLGRFRQRALSRRGKGARGCVLLLGIRLRHADLLHNLHPSPTDVTASAPGARPHRSLLAQNGPLRVAPTPNRRPPPPFDPSVPGLAARHAAREAVATLLGPARGLALEDALAQAARGAGLDAGEAALARAIATASFRRLGFIKAALAARLRDGLPEDRPHLLALLVTGAAQILDLAVADHAAVDLSVRLAKADPQLQHLVPLVNAVLRRIARERDAIRAQESDPLAHNTPDWLARRWQAAYGEETARRIAVAHLEGAAVDLTIPHDPEIWAERLGGHPTRSRIGAARRGAAGGGRASRLRGRCLVGAGCRRCPAGAAARACPGRARRRSLRSTRRQDSPDGRRRRRGDGGGPLCCAAGTPRAEPRTPRPLRRSGHRRCPRSAGGRALRRGAARCALLGDRHHPSPSRCRLDEERSGRGPLGRSAAPPARQGRAADAPRRSLGLLHLLPGARGRQRTGGGVPGPQSGFRADRDHARPVVRPCRADRRLGRPAHPALSRRGWHRAGGRARRVLREPSAAARLSPHV